MSMTELHTVTAINETDLGNILRVLIHDSVWFQVEPYPDDTWKVSFKAGEGHMAALNRRGYTQ